MKHNHFNNNNNILNQMKLKYFHWLLDKRFSQIYLESLHYLKCLLNRIYQFLFYNNRNKINKRINIMNNLLINKTLNNNPN